jgi:hypothetical protein
MLNFNIRIPWIMLICKSTLQSINQLLVTLIKHNVIWAVTIANSLWAELGFDSQQDQEEIFLFSIMFRPAMRSTQPPIQWVPEAVSLGVQQRECEADHLPPSSAEVKNADMPSVARDSIENEGPREINYGII